MVRGSKLKVFYGRKSLRFKVKDRLAEVVGRGFRRFRPQSEFIIHHSSFIISNCKGTQSEFFIHHSTFATLAFDHIFTTITDLLTILQISIIDSECIH